MSALDVESSLQPISSEQPCGEDLQYDDEFVAFETAMQGKPEQQYGETIIPAVSPDWKEARRIGLSLITRTKDLRVICHLTRAMIELEGIDGLHDSLAVARGYVEQHWDDVHPRLDPDDDNDPTERVNVLSSLTDKLTTIAQIRSASLVKSAVLGSFSFHDVQVVRGDATPLGEDDVPDAAAIEAAFMDCDLDELRDTTAAAVAAHQDAVALEAALTDKVGASNAVSFERLTDCLKQLRDYVEGQLASREGQDAGGGEEPAAADAAAPGPTSGGPAISGEIRSREDVIRTLDKICDYYDRFEPSSPLPMLLRRAKRLATKSFIDILEDLTPDGVSQARMIGGVDRSDGED